MGDPTATNRAMLPSLDRKVKHTSRFFSQEAQQYKILKQKLGGMFLMHNLVTNLSHFSGVNIGGAGSYVYDTPANNNNQSPTSVDSGPKAEEKPAYAAKQPSKGK